MNGNTDVMHAEQSLTVRDSIRQEYIKTREEEYYTPNYNTFVVLSKKQYTGKRAVDLLLGGLGFIVFALLFPIIALIIKLSSKGPVIFKQKRTGQNGRKFVCYKFRTMHQLDLRRIDGKPVVTKKGDKRIFWFGSWLRKTNLDELPQIINVLKGDMSLIGPRPYAVKECAHWNSTFDDFYYRYAVKPGISGLAQINGLRGGTLDEDHMRERLDKDLIYVENQSLKWDLYIIYHTVLQMFKLETNGH